MNEQQYRQSVENRRVYKPRLWLEPRGLAAWVRDIARRSAANGTLREAIAASLPEPWRGRVELESFTQGRVRLRAGDPAAAEWLRRRALRLAQDLTPHGVHTVEVLSAPRGAGGWRRH